MSGNIRQPDTITRFSNNLALWVERLVLWLAKHWPAVFNVTFLIYVGLPFLAPILLAYGYHNIANIIYRLYSYTCHQLPSRAYYVAGEQVALCHRDVAIYGAMVLGGLIFALMRARLKPLHVGWYFLLILPMAMDGGMGLLGEISQVVPVVILWPAGLITMGGLAHFLHRRGRLSRHWPVIFGCGLLALLYLQFVGPYSSDIYRRNITGVLFGFSTVWLVYPYFEEAFHDSRNH